MQPVERSDWDDDDLAPVAPLLPADDRVWRHPSELGPYVAATRSATSERGRSRFGLALVAGSAGALALAGALAVTSTSGPADTGPAAGGRGQQSGLLSSSLVAPAAMSADPDDRAARMSTPTNRLSSPPRPSVPHAATSTLVLVTTSAAHPGVATTTSPVVAWPAGSVMLSVERDGTVRSIAAIVLGDDGVLVTSAEALAGASAVLAHSAGMTLPVEVLGTDRATGLVVLHATGLTIASDLTAAAGLKRGSGVVIHVPDTSWSAKVSELGASAIQQGSTVEHLAVLQGDEQGTERESEPAVVTDSSGRVLGLCLMHDAKGRLMVPSELMQAAVRAVGASSEPTAWLGLRGANLETTDTEGAVVSLVEVGSAAEAAGMRIGDIITSFDDRPVASMWGLVLLVRSHPVGATVTIGYRRGADQRSTKIRLTAGPVDVLAATSATSAPTTTTAPSTTAAPAVTPPTTTSSTIATTTSSVVSPSVPLKLAG